MSSQQIVHGSYPANWLHKSGLLIHQCRLDSQISLSLMAALKPLKNLELEVLPQLVCTGIEYVEWRQGLSCHVGCVRSSGDVLCWLHNSCCSATLLDCGIMIQLSVSLQNRILDTISPSSSRPSYCLVILSCCWQVPFEPLSPLNCLPSRNKAVVIQENKTLKFWSYEHS